MKSVGTAPLLLSAMTPATHASASSMAFCSLNPFRRFWSYRARIKLSDVKLSNSSIGLDSLSPAFPAALSICRKNLWSVFSGIAPCSHALTSGSLPRRFVRNVLRSTTPSCLFIPRRVSHIPRRISVFLTPAHPCVSGIKFVIQDAGLIDTIFAATRPSSVFTRL